MALSRLLSIASIVALIATPVWAQSGPNGGVSGPGSTVTPQAVVAATAVPHAANTTALKAISIGSVYTTIIRDGVATAGDAPPLQFRASSNPCGISGGDIGSEVPSADSGCWLAQFDSSGVPDAEFGVDQTGTIDSSTQMQAAVTAAIRLGIRPLINAGTALIGASTINVTNSLTVQGGGFTASGTNNDLFYAASTNPLATQIKGVSFQNTSIFRSDNPTAGACIHYEYIQLIHNDNVNLTGCFFGLELVSVTFSTFDSTYIGQCSTAANAAGVLATRNTANAYSAAFNNSVILFSNLDIESKSSGSSCANTHDSLRIRNADGISVNGGHLWEGGRSNVYIQPLDSTDPVDNVYVKGGVDIDTGNIYGVDIVGISGHSAAFGTFDFSGDECELSGTTCFYVDSTATDLTNVKGEGMQFLANQATGVGADIQTNAGEYFDFSGSLYAGDNIGNFCSGACSSIDIEGGTQMNFSNSQFKAGTHPTNYFLTMAGASDYVTADGLNMNGSGTADFKITNTPGVHRSIGNNSVTSQYSLVSVQRKGFTGDYDIYSGHFSIGTGYTTLLTLTPSAVASQDAEVIIKYEANADSSGGGVVTGSYRCFVNNAAPVCANLLAPTSVGAGAPVFQTNISGNSIQVQAKSNTAAATVDGWAHVEVTANPLYAGDGTWSAQ